MFKTVEEFNVAFPNIADEDWDGIVIKNRALIAFKRPSLSATRKLVDAINSDKIDSFLQFASSCLITPSEAEFRALMEEYPMVLGQLEPILGSLGKVGISSAKKASG